MTLRSLAESYKGSITMNVFASVEDEKPIATFQSDNYTAIKDEILDKEAVNYFVKVLILYAEISVVLASDTPADEEATDTEETV